MSCIVCTASDDDIRASREFAQVDATLRQHVAAMCQQRDAELADPKLREPCRKALTSLLEHWSGLTVFLDDPRIPLDNNFAERLIRIGAGPQEPLRLGSRMGRSSGDDDVFHLSDAEALEINPRLWLSWYLESCHRGRPSAHRHPAFFALEPLG